jgi:hypothetical protein
MTTNKPTPLYGPNGTIVYNADGTKAMTTNKPEVVTMGDRYPESGCYQCGRLKTALSYRSRCLTCETQRADANADENDELRTQLSDCEALQAELETVKKVAYGNIELLERNEALQAECDALVEALEDIGASWHRAGTKLEKYLQARAINALATYHKQGGEL